MLIGEIVIDDEPPITLHAQLASDETREKSAVLKDKLAYLLGTRFRPAKPAPAGLYMSIEEVVETWHCYRATVLRMINEEQLHPLTIDGEVRFNRTEVLSLAKSVPARNR